MTPDPVQLQGLREQLARTVKDILRRKVALLPDVAPAQAPRQAPRVPPAEALRTLVSSFSESLPDLTDEELEADIELLDDDALPSVPGYALTGEVGRGGQGVVYRGTELATGRDVAVKVLHGGQFSGSRARARFAREIRILTRLAMSSVVPILAHGRTADGSSFLAMPYIDGLPLHEFAATLRGNDRAIATLFARVADVVHIVHCAGVVHRDLKPQNVRVDAAAKPHLLDFGLADSPVDRTRRLTRSGQVLGTLPWLSPEQARGNHRAVGPRSDIYALGLMLCRAVSAGGAAPYPVDGTYEEVMREIVSATPEVRGRAAGDALGAVVLRCLAKRPRDRYPSAAALAAALRAVRT